MLLAINTTSSRNNRAPNLLCEGSELKTSTTVISISVHKHAIDVIVLKRYLLIVLILCNLPGLLFFMQIVESNDKAIPVHLFFQRCYFESYTDHNSRLTEPSYHYRSIVN